MFVPQLSFRSSGNTIRQSSVEKPLQRSVRFLILSLRRQRPYFLDCPWLLCTIKLTLLKKFTDTCGPILVKGVSSGRLRSKVFCNISSEGANLRTCAAASALLRASC